jgi:hypothetical protein
MVEDFVMLSLAGVVAIFVVGYVFRTAVERRLARHLYRNQWLNAWSP